MIVQITPDNMNQYFDQYKKIYEKRFKTKYDQKDMINHLKQSKIYVYVDQGKVLGFIRYKFVTIKDKYLKHIKSKKAIFLSDLAAISSNKGVGSKLMNYLLSVADKLNLPIVTVPWNDKLLQYYTRFGFGAYYFKDSDLPKVILVRPSKSQQIIK